MHTCAHVGFGFMEVFMGGEMYFRTLLENFLDLKRIPYQHLRHPPAFTAEQLAAVGRVRGEMVAKTVVVKADEEFAMAVLPASRRVKLSTLRDSLPARHLRLATELEFRTLFPDSDVGVMSPFGNLYEIRVFAEESLAEDGQILFHAGTHEDAIQMKYDDFASVVHPVVCAFAEAA